MEGRREKVRKWGDTHTGLPKQNKKKMNSKNNDNIEAVQTLTIPDDVLFDHLLPRLPVKTLIRFKSVCKNWYSSISAPQFVKLHLQCSSSRHNFLLHSLFRSKDFFLLPYDEELGVKEVVKLDFESNHIDGRLAVVGSCNGLVCLHLGDESENHSLLLWNPATRELGRPIDSPLRHDFPYFFGFGYTSLTDDYKIVAAYKHGETETEGFDIYVFLLRTGNWKHIGLFKGFGVPFKKSNRCHGLLVDGTLYWCFMPRSPIVIVVAGFHLATEQFKEIARMNVSYGNELRCLYSMKGCLLAHRISIDGTGSFYTLKQQGDSSSWEKLFSVPPTMRLLLDFSKTGKCLMQDWGTWDLMFVDLIGGGLEEDQVISFNDMVSLVHYVESLVSVWNR